jgi:hypothetical protein
LRCVQLLVLFLHFCAGLFAYAGRDCRCLAMQKKHEAHFLVFGVRVPVTVPAHLVRVVS